MNESNKLEYDSKLWVELSHCEGKHYILGNPHTFPGRIMMWCPNKEVSFFMSKNEIQKCSKEAEYWIKGFLTGNEPEPPVGDDEMPDFESKEYSEWKDHIKEFHSKGIWDNKS
jgi:hypothetical protein